MFDVNGRQLLAVLAGIALCFAGVLVSMSPVGAALEPDGPAAAIPLLDPVDAFDRRPGRVLLALGLVVCGSAVAALGTYLGRDRHR